MGAVDASERVSDLLLRTGLFFLKNSVRVSQKNCRATEYNRKFSDAKIQQDTKETEPFMPAEKGLKMCLQNFLAGERQFTAPVNWKREGAMDKISGDRTPLKKIPGMKNKVKYVVYRYMK